MSFGPHLLFDGYAGNRESLTDLDHVFDFLNTLPERIGMTKISQPHVFKYNGVVPDDWGITGVVILAESHCSIHTFPERGGFVTIDIYSCKDFPADEVVSVINEYFKTGASSWQVIQRGEYFDRNKVLTE